MNIRIQYEVCGRMAFLSHLEMVRLWQRAFLRSALPVSWSQGFNPRPKIAPGPARNVGIESLSEFIDADLTKIISLSSIEKKLNDILPQGVHVLNVKERLPHSRALDAEINECIYKVLFGGSVPDGLKESIDSFLNSDCYTYTRVTPKGNKEINAREMVYDVDFKGNYLFVAMKTGSGGSLRVAELLDILNVTESTDAVKIIRIGLYKRIGDQRLLP